MQVGRVNATQKGSPRGELSPVRVTERGTLLKNNYNSPLRLEQARHLSPRRGLLVYEDIPLT